jgi:hypothetical protein
MHILRVFVHGNLLLLTPGIRSCAVGLCAARIRRHLLFACMANFSDPEDTYRFCHQMVHMPLIYRSMLYKQA